MYLTVYVVNYDYTDLYKIITENIDKFSNPILYKSNSGDTFEYNVFEGSLNNEEIIINFDGEINFIKLFIKYGQFLNIKSYYGRVIDFEKKLKDIFKEQIEIYRLDEILLEDLLINEGEFWYRKESANDVFKKWIINQEKMHWCKIAPQVME